MVYCIEVAPLVHSDCFFGRLYCIFNRVPKSVTELSATSTHGCSSSHCLVLLLERSAIYTMVMVVIVNTTKQCNMKLFCKVSTVEVLLACCFVYVKLVCAIESTSFSQVVCIGRTHWSLQSDSVTPLISHTNRFARVKLNRLLLLHCIGVTDVKQLQCKDISVALLWAPCFQAPMWVRGHSSFNTAAIWDLTQRICFVYSQFWSWSCWWGRSAICLIERNKPKKYIEWMMDCGEWQDCNSMLWTSCGDNDKYCGDISNILNLIPRIHRMHLDFHTPT